VAVGLPCGVEGPGGRQGRPGLRLLMPVVLALAAGACTPIHPSPAAPLLFTGTIAPSCAPHDAPSIEIHLAAQGGSPTILFNRWDVDPLGPGKTVRFEASSQAMLVLVCGAETDCAAPVRGRITFQRYHAGEGASGSLEILLGDGRILAGPFVVVASGGPVLCG
jgi:hypothetical protein